LVVGGDPFGRGVVSTASYEARQFGIHSAMSAAEARRRCPEAIFVRPDMAAYRRHSEAVWRLVETRCAAVQRLGLDEGYLDLVGVVGSARTAERFLVELQAAIHAGTGLSASFGCGTSKVVAKVASDFRKPAGVTVVAAGQEAAFLAPLPLRALPGIGPKADARLRAAAWPTIGDLAALPDDRLRLLLPGVVGVELRDRARGIDRRRVESAGPRRVRGARGDVRRGRPRPGRPGRRGGPDGGSGGGPARPDGPRRADGHRQAALPRLHACLRGRRRPARRSATPRRSGAWPCWRSSGPWRTGRRRSACSGSRCRS
jgi:nucleotidyltransferase/DNA polymerase involved in DNA repair